MLHVHYDLFTKSVFIISTLLFPAQSSLSCDNNNVFFVFFVLIFYMQNENTHKSRWLEMPLLSCYSVKFNYYCA